MRVGGTVSELWNQHQDFAREVANEVMDIQEYLTKTKFDREQVIIAIVNAINGDLDHQCMGRSAQGRLQRALEIVEQGELDMKMLPELKK